MGQVTPPFGVREHHASLQAVLDAVTDLAGYDGLTREPEIDVWLENRATVLTRYHLETLEGRGLVEKVHGPGDDGVASHWRLKGAEK